MSVVQIAVIVIGILVGYWVVSALVDSRKPARMKQENSRTDNSQTWSGNNPWAKEATTRPGCYEVLGIAPGADVETIRRAYKVLISQYHPDKVASLGKELQDLAEVKSKQIATAYREAMALAGEEV